MAANLNPPSHFLGKPLESASSQPVLLPPSIFERAQSTVDPWKALDKATSEITDLKEQNIKLQESKDKPVTVREETKAPLDACQHESSKAIPEHAELKYYLDIVGHQATEIVQLKDQLLQTSAKYEKQLAHLEGQLLLKESHHAQQLASLEERLKLLTEQYEMEKKKLVAAKDKCESDHLAATRHWQEEMESNKDQYLSEIDELKTELHEVEQKYVTMETELTNKIREYERLFEEQKRTISQMKTYLKENATPSSEICKREVECLKQKLEDKDLQVSKLAAHADSLNIRLKSLNELMLLQEKELSKVKDTGAEKKKHCLLTRWREKLFELLVQIKCTELSHEDERQQWKNQLNKVSEDLETCQMQVNRLQCLVEDKQAQLDMEVSSRKMLEHELTRAQEVAITLDDKVKKNEAAIIRLVDLSSSIFSEFCALESKHKQSTSLLSSFSQRLAYASGRVELLQGQFARKEAIIRLEAEEATRQHPKPDEERSTGTDVTDSLAQLKAELARVTNERDTLASQIKADARLLEQKVLDAKQQVAEEVSLLKLRIEELHTDLEAKTKEATDLRQQLSGVRQESEECHETVELLKGQLAQCGAKAEQEREAVCKQLKAQLTEQLAEMEQRLNEARREQSKAVVSLRQMERGVTRERKRLAEQLATLEEHYKEELTKTKEKWLTAEKDRNLLMATLRQEGLIGKYKSQRLSAGTVSGNDSRVQGETSGKHRQEETLTNIQDQEPLHTVIDDVRAMARAVLEDSDDELDEDLTTRERWSDG